MQRAEPGIVQYTEREGGNGESHQYFEQGEATLAAVLARARVQRGTAAWPRICCEGTETRVVFSIPG